MRLDFFTLLTASSILAFNTNAVQLQGHIESELDPVNSELLEGVYQGPMIGMAGMNGVVPK